MKNRNWFWGLFFLISAVFVILSQTWFLHEISVLSILATVFLAAIVISSLLKLNFSGIFIPLSILYIIYSKPFKLMYISPWLLISSAVLISIGFSLLFSKQYKKTAFLHDIHDQNSRMSGNTDENNPNIKVVLNSTSKYIHSECLKGGYLASYLGVLDVYFDQAELSADGAVFYIDNVLGTVNLYIPKYWDVAENIHSYLGDVSCKTAGTKPSKDAPRLTLAGKATLGDVNIFYI